MAEKVKIYSPNRPDEDLLKSLMGNDFEYVTHLGDEGDYVIIDPHFYPSQVEIDFLNSLIIWERQIISIYVF